MNKKKYLNILSIFLLVLLFTLSGTCYANWTQGEFEYKVKQVLNVATEDEFTSNDYSTMFTNFLNSNAYNQYKNSIPFDEYEYLWFGVDTSYNIRLRMSNTNTSFYVNSSSAIINNSNFSCYSLKFSGNRSYQWTFVSEDYNESWSANSTLGYTYPNITGTQYFICCFLDNLTNQYNKTIYGANMTAYTPVYNGSTNVDIGQYYKLVDGFIGQYYMDNYELLEYPILCNDTTLYQGLKNISYTPTTNGSRVEIYIYIEPSMNQKGYRVQLYYDNEVLYSKTEWNTLIVNGGSSSGDIGGGGGSVDLTQTNNLIIGIGNIIKSGDDRIVNAIKSGDERLISAITSGDNKIISTLTDDSEVDSLLGDLYSSGDDINDLVSDLNFKRFDNPYQNLIFGTIENICDSLYGSGDAYITINLHNGKQKRIYASEFYIQDSILRGFVSSFLVFGILFVLYNYFRKSIDSISSGDAKKVIDNIEVDTNFIKM